MSLQYVTRKLKTQSLADENNKEDQDIHQDTDEDENITSLAKVSPEDSGTESDDEFDGGKVQRKHNKKSFRRKSSSFSPPPPAFSDSKVILCDDNYSSEEELKEIENCKRRKKYLTKEEEEEEQQKEEEEEHTEKKEKRKWHQMSQEEQPPMSKSPSSSTFLVRAASNGSSGDEEVSCLLLVPSNNSSSSSSAASSTTATLVKVETPSTPAPVQFCASPPLDVYRPRQSQSPPPKLFHMMNNSNQQQKENWNNKVPYTGAPSSTTGVFRPSPAKGFVSPFDLGLHEIHKCDESVSQYPPPMRETPSPHKRQRSRTPKPQNLQRPCLDFEKMQQIKKRVVTSWRPQGTELSLFCW